MMKIVISRWDNVHRRQKIVLEADVSSGNYDLKSLYISPENLDKLLHRYPLAVYNWMLEGVYPGWGEEGEILPILDEVLLEDSIVT